MTLLMANQLPNATIYGIDLSPVPTSSKSERFGGHVNSIEGNVLTLMTNTQPCSLGPWICLPPPLSRRAAELSRLPPPGGVTAAEARWNGGDA
jgi:hypothetical protein